MLLLYLLLFFVVSVVVVVFVVVLSVVYIHILFVTDKMNETMFKNLHCWELELQCLCSLFNTRSILSFIFHPVDRVFRPYIFVWFFFFRPILVYLAPILHHVSLLSIEILLFKNSYIILWINFLFINMIRLFLIYTRWSKLSSYRFQHTWLHSSYWQQKQLYSCHWQKP